MSNGNEPAYPIQTERRDDGVILQWSKPGLTKRELFAMAAMQGQLSRTTASFGGFANTEQLVESSVSYADWLLDELAKPARDPATLTDAELDAAIAEIDRQEDELAKRADMLRGIRANRKAENLLDNAIGFNSESLNNLAIRAK